LDVGATFKLGCLNLDVHAAVISDDLQQIEGWLSATLAAVVFDVLGAGHRERQAAL
jgi:hypothetical protein